MITLCFSQSHKQAGEEDRLTFFKNLMTAVQLLPCGWQEAESSLGTSFESELTLLRKTSALHHPPLREKCLNAKKKTLEG